MKRISAPVWMMASFIAGIVFVHSCGNGEQSIAQSSSAADITGSIIVYAGGTVPSEYLLCDGSEISRTTYADLFAAIGTAWGGGDGSTTFNLPDLRGQFLRGLDDTGTIDPDGVNRTVGSLQSDAFQGHWHQYSSSGHNADFVAGSIIVDYQNSPSGGYGPVDRVRAPVTDGMNGTPRTKSETRPTNVAVSFIIKV